MIIHDKSVTSIELSLFWQNWNFNFMTPVNW